jgi:hypothetical protein
MKSLLKFGIIVWVSTIFPKAYAQPINEPRQVIPELYPTKTLNIAFHVVHKYHDLDSTNMPNDSLTRHYFRRRMDSLNKYLAQPPVPNHKCYIGPALTTKIQLNLVGVYYPIDTICWYDRSIPQFRQRLVLDNPNFGKFEKDSVLHAFLPGDGTFGGRAGGIPTRLGMRFMGRQKDYYSWMRWEPNGTHGVDYNYIHELAHCLGLSHNFKNSPEYSWNECMGCDAKLGGICFEHNDSIVPNNTMYKGPNKPKGEAFSYCQLQRIIYFTYGLHEARRGSLSDISMCTDYVSPCSSNYEAIIAQSDTLDYDFEAYGNIRIKNGVRFVITSRLKMPSGSKIIVEPGAELVVSGGSLSNNPDCIKPWFEIEKKKGKWYWWIMSKERKKRNTPGQVLIENGGTVILKP